MITQRDWKDRTQRYDATDKGNATRTYLFKKDSAEKMPLRIIARHRIIARNLSITSCHIIRSRNPNSAGKTLWCRRGNNNEQESASAGSSG